MTDSFTIGHAAGRTTAAIKGFPPGGQPPPRPGIVPIFLPMIGCVHRCAFCNQSAITGTRPGRPSGAAVARSILIWLKRVPPERRPVQIAFYGGNFLGQPLAVVRELLSTATAFVSRGVATGIRFSTRPDTITDRRLAAIADFPVTTIELGLQSLDDRVLDLVRRGHDAACTIDAAGKIKAAGFELGLQMMTGLPGDTPSGALRTAREMVGLAPDFVRIYPTLVLAGSPLAARFRSRKFEPAPLEATIDLVGRLLLVFACAGIPVIRMGLQADEGLRADGAVLAGPYHPSLGEQVLSRIFYALAAAALERHPDQPPSVVIRVHPRHLSAMIGAGRINLQRLQDRQPARPLFIRADPGIGPHHLELASPDDPHH
jgi:histone acetyltransferase (RNA polymerase elongator complex component)